MPLLAATYEFPPGVPPTWMFWATHLAVVVLAVGACAGVLLRSIRPARAIDLLVWLLLIPSGGLVFAVSPVGDDVSSAFQIAVTSFIGATAIAGFLVTAIRLSQGRPGPRLGLAASCLAIFAVLTLILLPATPTAREAARRTQCRNNLHNIGLGLLTYVDLSKTLPDPVADSDTKPRSWRVDLLPFVDGGPLREQYDDSTDWDQPPNKDLAKTPLPVFLCPSNLWRQDQEGRFYTAYAAMTGPNSAFAKDLRPGFPGTIADGASTTMLVIEACGQRIVWTEPRDVDASKQPIGVNLSGDRIASSPGIASSYHPGGAYAAFADGSARFLNKSIDPKVLKALTTANGGETLQSLQEF